jgi:hypothetical protein
MPGKLPLLDLQCTPADWHNKSVLPPWVIQELEQERLQNEEEERLRSLRIELPQSSKHEDGAPVAPPGGVNIVDISPRDPNVIDL